MTSTHEATGRTPSSSSPVGLPRWPAFVRPAVEEGWDDFVRMARAGVDVHHQELGLLLARVERADPAIHGPDGTPLLTALMRGWAGVAATYVGGYRLTATHDRGERLPLARFPLPGEAPWDPDGGDDFLTWELPAAALIAKGADPFETGPDGARPWDVAVQYGMAAVVAQMLRHPSCPRLDDLQLRPLLNEDQGVGSHHRFPTFKQSSPILHAIQRKNLSLLEALLEGGFAADAPDSNGNTALFEAIGETDGNQATSLADALFRYGANPVHENTRGLVALEYWMATRPSSVSPDLRLRWAEAVRATGVSHPERVPRAVAAAAFSGCTDVLAKIPGKPRGMGWVSMTPFGADGPSVLEWAATGMLARQPLQMRAQVSAVVLKNLSVVPWPDGQRAVADVTMMAASEAITAAPLPPEIMLSAIERTRGLLQKPGLSLVSWGKALGEVWKTFPTEAAAGICVRALTQANACTEKNYILLNDARILMRTLAESILSVPPPSWSDGEGAFSMGNLARVYLWANAMLPEEGTVGAMAPLFAALQRPTNQGMRISDDEWRLIEQARERALHAISLSLKDNPDPLNHLWAAGRLGRDLDTKLPEPNSAERKHRM